MNRRSTVETVSRRLFLTRTAAVAAAQAADRGAQGYQLGVMATLYASLPLEDAMSRIRKAGFRYVCMGAAHAGVPVFSPAMAKPERAAMLRRIKDLGVQPFMALGFGPDLQTEAGVTGFVQLLDLCADFEIPVVVSGGPWYYQRFPNIPRRELDWQKEVTRFYGGLEKAVRHAEQAGVTVTLKPHTGITARARDCMEVVKRVVSPRLKICWDAGNVSFYEGIYPDPDLPDLAPQVRAVCIKDHLGLRGDANFPTPGQGQIDHELMFRTLFAAGFNGPMAIERLNGREPGRLPPEVVDERLATASRHLVPLLDRITKA